MRLTQLTGLATLLPFCAAPAFATLITFDDLPAEYPKPPGSYDPSFEPAWAARPLTDQYAHLGLSFGEGDLEEILYQQSSESGAALTTYDEVVVSGPNAVSSQYTHDGLRFWFAEDVRPEYLSFYASAPWTGAMTIYVYETGGTTQELRLGWRAVDGVFEYTDRTVRQKVEFFSDGIEAVYLSNFTGHRTNPVYMDDLYFVPGRAVPEPAGFSLLLSGVLGLGIVAWRRRAAGRFDRPRTE